MSLAIWHLLASNEVQLRHWTEPCRHIGGILKSEFNVEI